MADTDAHEKRKRSFRRFQFRGVDLEQLLELSLDDLLDLFHARARRKLIRKNNRRAQVTLIDKLRKAKKAAPEGEKPEAVRTHLRDVVVLPEMIGSLVGVYNGKTFNQVEIKEVHAVQPEMVGHYLGEFSITYKPVRHGRAGLGSTTGSRFIPLK